MIPRDGVIVVNGLGRAVHRMAWEVAHGPIPDGLIVMHTCDNPPCCNPEHLKLGTHGDNNRDRIEKGRGPGARARDLELNPQWARGRRRIGPSAVRDNGGYSRHGPRAATAPLAKRKRPPRSGCAGALRGISVTRLQAASGRVSHYRLSWSSLAEIRPRRLLVADRIRRNAGVAASLALRAMRRAAGQLRRLLLV